MLIFYIIKTRRDVCAIISDLFICLQMVLFIFAPGNMASAAESSYQLTSESEYFTEIPSVNTVTHLPQPKSETPAAVTIIDREMIHASGARTLPEVFRLVPGMQIAHSSGAESSVTYHGLSDRYARRMQVLVDGRSVYGAWQRSVIWPTINIAIEDIERIEVMRGPNTVAYGANAFFATINIITDHSSQTKGSTMKLAAGDNDIRDGFARYGTDFDGGSIRFSAEYKSDDGLEGFTNRYQQRSFNLRTDLQPTANDNLMFQYGIGETNVQLGDNSILFPNDTNGGSESHYELLHWTHTLRDDGEVGLKFYHNQISINAAQLSGPVAFPPPIGVAQVPINITATEHRYDFELQHILPAFDGWRFVWGVGASEDNARSDYYFTTTDTFKNESSRLFANMEWKATKDAVVNAGLMWENTDIAGTNLSPRLALNYHLNNHHTLRAIFSKAIRTPSLFEEHGDLRFQYMNFLVNHLYNNNGDLEAEKLTTFELGYLAQTPKPNTSIDIRLYRDEITDYINLISIPSPDLTDNVALSYRNEGEITIDGIDIELTYRPSQDTRIVLTNSWMHADVSQLSTDSVYNKSQLQGSVPDYSGSLLLMHKLNNNWNASLGYYWVSNMLWMRQLTSADNNEQPLDSYTHLDLRLARQFKLTDTRNELGLVIQNIGGEYADFAPNQYYNTRAFITFQMNF